MSQPPDDPLAAVLTAGRREVDHDAVAPVSAELAGRIAATTPRRRTRRRVVALALATALVATPTAAAAYVWSTHTGLFGQPDRYTEDVDGSEWLDLCAPDFRTVAEDLAPAGLPLPDGLTLPMVQEELFGTPAPDCAGARVRQQATGVARRYENYAWCSWVNVYVASPDRRDAAAVAMKTLANTELARIVSVDGSVLALDNEIADAAAAGDVDRVRREQRVNCDGFGWRP